MTPGAPPEVGPIIHLPKIHGHQKTTFVGFSNQIRSLKGVFFDYLLISLFCPSYRPKIFFLDMGFRNNIMENMNGLDKRSDAGAIIENSLFIRLNELSRDINKINFWRTKAGAEADFVLHIGGGELLPIEVKFAPFSSEKLSKGLASFIRTFKPKQAAVLTKNYWGFAKLDKTEILFIPLYYL